MIKVEQQYSIELTEITSDIHNELKNKDAFSVIISDLITYLELKKQDLLYNESKRSFRLRIGITIYYNIFEKRFTATPVPGSTVSLHNSEIYIFLLKSPGFKKDKCGCLTKSNKHIDSCKNKDDVLTISSYVSRKLSLLSGCFLSGELSEDDFRNQTNKYLRTVIKNYYTKETSKLLNDSFETRDWLYDVMIGKNVLQLLKDDSRLNYNSRNLSNFSDFWIRQVKYDLKHSNIDVCLNNVSEIISDIFKALKGELRGDKSNSMTSKTFEIIDEICKFQFEETDCSNFKMEFKKIVNYVISIYSEDEDLIFLLKAILRRENIYKYVDVVELLSDKIEYANLLSKSDYQLKYEIFSSLKDIPDFKSLFPEFNIISANSYFSSVLEETFFVREADFSLFISTISRVDKSTFNEILQTENKIYVKSIHYLLEILNFNKEIIKKNKTMSASIFEVDSLSEKDIDYIEQLIERNVILELSTISDFDEQKLFDYVYIM